MPALHTAREETGLEKSSTLNKTDKKVVLFSCGPGIKVLRD